MELLHNPILWVAVSALIFAALAFRKIAGALFGALDGRASAIAEELKTAEELKEQAKALLTDAKLKQATAQALADRILQEAHEEAKRFTEESESLLKETLERRTQLALEKIASYEHSVAESIRDRVLTSALEAVRAALLRGSEDGSTDEFAETALSSAEKRLN